MDNDRGLPAYFLGFIVERSVSFVSDPASHDALAF